ncbi:WD40 repeat domain-containing protein [Candidatus Leptofilum sp.]|uniref:nSTAND1 domain-containing NTPase n=1 Tax=Candidatus Leptofilum sp. TaxID=3241576 RepID=UPI003B58FE21
MSNQEQPPTNQNAQQLRKELLEQMATAFTKADVEVLCFQAEIPFAELGSETLGLRPTLVKLIEMAERHGKLDALMAACTQERPGYDWPIGSQPDQPCPYRGLFAFQEEDAALFFGREAFTEMLTEFVLARPLTAVVGPSGSGKSSVVFAGLVPVLRQQGKWLVVKFRPGERPFHALASVLLPHLDPTLSKVDQLAETKKLATRLLASDLTLADILPTVLGQQPPETRLLLIADQFEELFTLCPDEETRHHFLDLLLAETNADGMHLVCTLRADFMGQALAYPPLVAALQNNDVKLGPMTPDELRRAIEAPATKAHVQFEEKLVDRILEDVGTDGRNLPLLEFALTELWQQQRNHRLTHTAYERIGQVRGALARHADAVYNSLTTAEQAQAERIFVQLVHPGAGAEDTRRLATKDDIDETDWTLVQKLADSRLLVTDRDESGQETAEVIHEALIQRWQRLQEWMNTHREFRAWQERLRADLQQWLDHNAENGFLLQGAPLSVAKEWFTQRRDSLSKAERTFIKASLKQLEREEAEKEAQRQRELAQERKLSEERRRTNIRLGFLVVAAFIATAVAIFFGVSSNLASQKAIAEGQARTWAASADRLRLNNNARQSLIFAYQAVNITHQQDKTVTAEAFNALQNTLGITEIEGQLIGHTASVNNAVFSPDGHRILTASDDNTARLWDADGTLRATLIGHSALVRNAVFSPNGDRILTASEDNTAKLWNADGTLLNTLEGHTNLVNKAVFSPNGDRILTASGDYTARLWNADGSPLNILEGHTNWVSSASFSPNGNRILTASGDYTARLWDADGSPLNILEGHTNWVSSASFSPDGDHILTAGGDNIVKLWNADGSLLNTLEGHTDWVSSASFSLDGNRILSASHDSTARLWNIDGTLLTILEGHTGWISQAVFSPNGIRILTASGDHTARLWDADGTLLTTLKGHDALVRISVFSPDGNHILTVSDDNTAGLWDADGTLIHILEGHKNWVSSASFSPNGDHILTASGDYTAKLWDAEGSLLNTLEGHTGWVRSAVFSPDGQRILTAGDDNTAKIWDADGSLLNTLEGHTSGITSAVFSPDGQRILTASHDNTARIWDSNGNLLATLEGHTGTVSSAVFSPDGLRILTASSDKTARLWPHYQDVESMLAEAKRRLLLMTTESECLELFTESECDNR